MNERFNITQEDTLEIQRSIEFNRFFKDEIIKPKVEQFNSEDLLSLKNYDEEKELNLVRDEFLEKFSIEEILESILKTPYTIRDYGVIEIETTIKDNELPEGYGYKGGYARHKLREVLRLPSIPPRDIDLIRLSPKEFRDGLDKILAEKFMAQDFELGDGVEVTTDAAYMSTRDFTINEVYVENNTIFATEQCIRDTLRNIIKVTDFERQTFQSTGKLGPKMKAKALRLHTEQLYKIGVSTIPENDESEIKGSFINPFWIAVQLDRSFERGESVADKFTSLLKQYEVIPQNISSGLELGDYLLGELYDFNFRNAPKLQYKFEEETRKLEELSDIQILEDYFDTVYHGNKH